MNPIGYTAILSSCHGLFAIELRSKPIDDAGTYATVLDCLTLKQLDSFKGDRLWAIGFLVQESERKLQRRLGRPVECVHTISEDGLIWPARRNP